MEREDYDRLARDLLESSPLLGRKISAAIGCERDLALRALVEVLRFLSLVASRPSGDVRDAKGRGMLTPSERVDLAWHELILFTRLYDELCATHFGGFVHHAPGGKDEDNHRQFRETQRAYCERFGELDPFFWGEAPPGADAFGCGACEGSSGSDAIQGNNSRR